MYSEYTLLLGIAIKVISDTTSAQPTRAPYILDSPSSVHAWLEELAARREAKEGLIWEPE